MTNQPGSDHGNANRGKPADPSRVRTGDGNADIRQLRNAVDDELKKLNALDHPVRINRITAEPVIKPSRDLESPVSKGDQRDHNRLPLISASVLFGLLIGVSATYNSVIQKNWMNYQDIGRVKLEAPVGSSASLTQSSPPRARNDVDISSTTRVSPPSDTSPSEQSSTSTSSSSTSNIQWQACVEEANLSGPPPQPGETWWPVVGPSESLADARRHCRADAFINRSGNAQISSFRDQETALAFADRLSQDSTHRWTFRVGEPSLR